MLDVRQLAGLSGLRRYRAGEVLVREGDIGGGEMFLILSGEALIIKTRGHVATHAGTLPPGGVCGETALFNGEPYSFTAIAKQDVAALVVDRNTFPLFAVKNPRLVFQLCEMLSFQRMSGDPMEMLPGSGEEYQLSVPANAATATETKTSAAPSQTPTAAVIPLTLLPEGHRRYNRPQPADFAPYLINRRYVCPVCKKGFQSPSVLGSKLRPKQGLPADFRREFQDFDTIWFSVLTCPHCLFAALTNVYEDPGALRVRELAEPLAVMRKAGLVFSEPRDIDQVFTAYYMALMCLPAYGTERRAQCESRLWRHIVWLYRDVGDDAMEQMAIRNAYAAVQQMYSQVQLASDEEQATCIILGNFARRLKDYPKALQYLGKAKLFRGGKPIYVDLADREIDEVRAERDGVVTDE